MSIHVCWVAIELILYTKLIFFDKVCIAHEFCLQHPHTLTDYDEYLLWSIHLWQSNIVYVLEE